MPPNRPSGCLLRNRQRLRRRHRHASFGAQSALQEIAAEQGIEQAAAQVLDPGLVSTVFDRSRRQYLARHQPLPLANLARF